jgi:hypothetical protein
MEVVAHPVATRVDTADLMAWKGIRFDGRFFANPNWRPDGAVATRSAIGQRRPLAGPEYVVPSRQSLCERPNTRVPATP